MQVRKVCIMVSKTVRKPTHKAIQHFTELGNMERMFALYGGDIRYCKALGWLVWDGVVWEPNAEKVATYAVATIRSMYSEAASLLDAASKTPDSAKEKRNELSSSASALTNWAKHSETLKMVQSMIGLLKSHPGIHIEMSELDRHPYLFNFSNCTVDVRTGKQHAHSRDDFLTMSVPFRYNPDASSPTFQRFVAECMLGNVELVGYLQKAFGMCLTADVSEQKWFLLIGSGANGKTTLLEAIAYTMSDYATTIDPATISVSRKDGSAASSDIASLRGKRLVRVSETEQGTRLASELVKRMTGGDAQKARFLYKDEFEFLYTHKLFVYTNHEPVVEDASVGFWRRVCRIPFNLKLEDPQKDLSLPKKLQDEAEGILAWMVRGAIAWHKEGLAIPEIVTNATREYQQAQDILGTFIRQYCLCDKAEKVRTSVFRAEYNKWLEEEQGMRLTTQPKLKRDMQDRGYFCTHTREGDVYIGVNLRSSAKKPHGEVVATPKDVLAALDGNEVF